MERRGLSGWAVVGKRKGFIPARCVVFFLGAFKILSSFFCFRITSLDHIYGFITQAVVVGGNEYASFLAE